jgi:hypothetical protein
MKSRYWWWQRVGRWFRYSDAKLLHIVLRISRRWRILAEPGRDAELASYTPCKLLDKWFKEFRFFRYHAAIRREKARWRIKINGARTQ